MHQVKIDDITFFFNIKLNCLCKETPTNGWLTVEAAIAEYVRRESGLAVNASDIEIVNPVTLFVNPRA